MAITDERSLGDEQSLNFATSLYPQLSRLLAASNSPESSAKFDKIWVAESFQVWTLCLEEFLSETEKPLQERVRWADIWHHQLRATPDGPAVAFARSLGKDGKLDLRAVHFSPLAGEIDRAIQWVDEKRPEDDWRVRLLEVPELRLPMLWLENGVENQFGILLQETHRIKRKLRTEPFYSEAELRSQLKIYFDREIKALSVGVETGIQMGMNQVPESPSQARVADGAQAQEGEAEPGAEQGVAKS